MSHEYDQAARIRDLERENEKLRRNCEGMRMELARFKRILADTTEQVQLAIEESYRKL